MKKFITTLQSISETLQEKKIFHQIGITYQVFWNLFLVFIILGLMSIVFIGGAGAGYFASLVQDEPLRNADEMKESIYNYEETSQAYFANNVLIGELPTEIERHQVALSHVSEHLLNAIIATEDEYFYEHDGIVPKAILRATFQEFANSSVQTGGSTLTQQLVKNQILTSDVSFDRKATEILLAMRLETYLEKEEILEAYLNVVPFGRNASGRQIAGVQAAAQGIFGVDAKDLTIPQAAYIAGLPQSPFGYTPFTGQGEVKENLEPGLDRMKTVLRRMHEGGYITEAEYEEALTYDLREHLTKASASPIDEFPYLTYEVMRRAEDILVQKKLEEKGINLSELEGEERTETLNQLQREASAELVQSGYRIHTTIDKDIYVAMQESVNNPNLFGPNRGDQQEEVGAVLIENRTGAIKGFVGGRNEGSDENHYNYATQAYRQNGSTMKPLLAYAPAMEVGAVQPGIVIPDTPATYPGTSQQINNFDRQYLGLLSARESLARSRNVPAVRAFLQVPHEQARETMKKFGFRINEGEPYPAAPLGSTDYNVTVEQNTNAYATFANGGKFIQSYLIERIETADGELVYEHQSEAVDVFTPQTSYLMIDMMRDVLRGVGTASSLPGRLKFSADWAGKTGTSSDVRDSWFVGTNPNVTLGVWIGYNQPQEIQRTVNGLRYGPRTQQIWANIANSAYDQDPELMAPSQPFAMPEGIVRRSICSLTGMLPSAICEQAGLVTSDLFNAKFVPGSTDSSLEGARYVTIDGMNYLALASTPEEFTDFGVTISEDYWGINSLSEYLPDGFNNLVPNRTAPDNGMTPSAVSNISLNGQTLSWAKHPGSDIVGYRIYRASGDSNQYSRVSSVKGNETTSYTVGGGNYSYYVTAVDTAGRESGRSSTVSRTGASPNNQASPEQTPANGQESNGDANQSPENGNGNNTPPSNGGNGSNNGGTPSTPTPTPVPVPEDDESNDEPQTGR
ncbi:transglycosylase domain-containing protein [Halalkalibacterium ligniniphilum]|uniref:transglycosylase domain-containing protein n=1 Tax=Halalkalibacterium ligniniphilum TaxID=1134413 RepID=UPI0003449C52|nr:transglycosylase domain-containing protein [Halalkalibacterium ligniniphilum]